MTRSTSTPASAPPPGTDRYALFFLLAALIGLLSPFSSCSSSSEDSEDQLEGSLDDNDLNKNNANANANSKDDGEGDDDDDDTVKADDGLPHPQKATAWHTRVMVATTPQPSADKVSACYDQVRHIAADAGNQQDMISAQNQVTNLAAQDISTYHYCFYQMAVSLDERMDLGGPMMSELATAFFSGMKELWLMARGLDQLSGRTTYFEYLQKRYIQMSKDYFGRDVQVVGPPMSNVHTDFGSLPPLQAKPAGPAPVP